MSPPGRQHVLHTINMPSSFPESSAQAPLLGLMSPQPHPIVFIQKPQELVGKSKASFVFTGIPSSRLCWPLGAGTLALRSEWAVGPWVAGPLDGDQDSYPYRIQSRERNSLPPLGSWWLTVGQQSVGGPRLLEVQSCQKHNLHGPESSDFPGP